MAVAFIITFLKKLLFKLWFEDFQIFLRLCTLFIILAPQNPPKKSSQLLEKGVPSDKFTFIVLNTC